MEDAKFELAPEDREEFISVISDLRQLGFYLFGSRQMFKNYDIDDPTDWDFLAGEYRDYAVFPVDFLPTANPTELARRLYIQKNFTVHRSPKKPNYGVSCDCTYRSLLKHNKFPIITIVVKSDAEIFKAMWEKISFDFWHTNLWKSNPNSWFHLDNHEWRKGVGKIFSILYHKERKLIERERMIESLL